MPTQHNLRLHNEAVTLAIRLRLGLPDPHVTRTLPPRCPHDGVELNPATPQAVRHLHACQAGGGRFLRHEHVVRAARELGQRAGIIATLTYRHMYRDHGGHPNAPHGLHQPDLMYNGLDGSMGPSAFVDVTVWNPCAIGVRPYALTPITRTRPGTHRQGGGCANHAEYDKRTRAARNLRGRICLDRFCPMALDVYGAQGDSTVDILHALHNHARRQPRGPAGANWAAPTFAVFANQRLSLALQRGLHAQSTRRAAQIWHASAT